MNQHTERRIAAQAGTPAEGTTPRLVDLMYEGFYAIFLLNNGCAPQDDEDFGQRITGFLDEVGRASVQHGIAAEDVTAAKYAFCAALDEIILRSSYPVRQAWERQPLQLKVFGDQLAGEHFFDRLDGLRAKGGAHLQALEVFHLCLLLGFEGRYAVQGGDKLGNLNTRLGEEIARLHGKQGGFAPHAPRPDEIVNSLRSDMSIWLLLGAFAIAGLGAWFGFSTALQRETTQSMAAYNDLVKLPPRAAHVVITLP